MTTNKSLYTTTETSLIKVGPAEPTPTHDIKFTDKDGNKLGLILANRMGKNDPKAMVISAMPRTAMRTAQGSAGYDDLELPFTTEVQETWIGGRGQETFSNDRTRFYDSYRMDTTKQYPVCAPAVIEQTGLIANDVLSWGEMTSATSFGHTTNQIYLASYKTTNELVINEIKIAVTSNYTATLYYDVIDYGESVPETPHQNPDGTIYRTNSNFPYSVTVPITNRSIMQLSLPVNNLSISEGHYFGLVYKIIDDISYQVDILYAIGLADVRRTYFASNDYWYDVSPNTAVPLIEVSSNVAVNTKLFEYKRQLYAVLNNVDKAEVKLFMNGWRGVADANTGELNKLKDATQAGWADNAAEGCVVLITNGTGEAEDQPWRLITSSASGVLTVSSPWKITHDTTTEYVILGSNVWTEIGASGDPPASHGLTKAVTDVEVVSPTTKAEYVVFAQGAYVSNRAAIRFMREYNNSGTWTREFAGLAATQWEESDDGQDAICYADFLEVGVLETGETVLWRARADNSKVDFSYIGAWDAESGNSYLGTSAMLYFDINRNLRNDMKIARARAEEDKVDELAKPNDEQDVFFKNSLENQMEDYTWQITKTATAQVGDSAGSDNWDGTFRTEHKFLPYYITCGNTKSDITNMIMYGTPKIPYIMKEDSIGNIYNNIYQEIPIEELHSVRSEINGTAAMHYGVYLYFNLEGCRIERYYDMRLDDVSVTRDEGLPSIRMGEIAKMLPYPGRYYAAINAGLYGISSVMCNNELGWHEIYRSDTVGAPITDIYMQAIPGNNYPDRLWISEGSNLIALPIAITPLQQYQYEFFGHGTTTLSNVGYIETSWIDFGLKDVNKYFHSIKIFSDYSDDISSGQEYKINVQFKTDIDTDWIDIGFTRAEVTKELMIQYPEAYVPASYNGHNVFGKKIKFRIYMRPVASAYQTPILKAIVVNGVLRMPVKRSWNITVHLEPMKDLQDKPLTDTPGMIYDKLFAWSDSETHATPLLMNTNDIITDNKYVFIDPASVSSFQALQIMGAGSKQKEYRHIGQLTIYEV